MDSEVVVATAEPSLRDAAFRWCAAAGVSATDCGSVDETRRRWRAAGLVLLGDDLATEISRQAWPRRDGVHVLARRPDDAWRTAVEVGAVGVLGLDDDAAAVRVVGASLDNRSEGCGLAVVGANGGIGATTFAWALAHQASQRALSACVIDADPWGSGLDLVAGSERSSGLRWSSLATAGGRVSPDSLAQALPEHRGVCSITWATDDTAPQLPAAGPDVWSAATRAFDVVVVDEPRSDPDATWRSAVLGGSVLTVLVVADDIAGVAAAQRQVARLAPQTASMVAVAAPVPGGLGRSGLERILEIPLVSTIKRDRRLRAAVNNGRSPARSRPVTRAARDVLDLVGLDRT